MTRRACTPLHGLVIRKNPDCGRARIAGVVSLSALQYELRSAQRCEQHCGDASNDDLGGAAGHDDRGSPNIDLRRLVDLLCERVRAAPVCVQREFVERCRQRTS
jgi:hypothetical protein